MRTGIAVIGANYGDEGKGLVTDFISSRLAGDCTVVRFNGGAQAGHTVVVPDGRRHVFSHFGAGSFSGCPTHLSQFFVINPRLFAKELGDLKRLCLTPRITIDARAFLTTPLDVLVNQAIEEQRGSGRHGSCGVGINETVTRCLRSQELRIQAQDLLNPKLLHNRILQLSQTWLPLRLKELRVDIEGSRFLETMNKVESIVSVFIDECEEVLNNAEITFDAPNSKYIVFEGAQGLMLDENRLDQFPHVTRSKTGLENVAFLSNRYGIERLKVHYVTRTYLTKHGAGPLPNECPWQFPDATNVPNPFQGILRFAPLDIENLRYSIDLDLRRGQYLFPNLTAEMAVTCLDQHPMPDLSPLSLPINIASYGPGRESVWSHLNSALKPISRASAVLRA
jgi:adenylosuccinate synthase